MYTISQIIEYLDFSLSLSRFLLLWLLSVSTTQLNQNTHDAHGSTDEQTAEITRNVAA